MDNKESKFNQTNVYRVRKNTKLNQALFLCKVIIKKHGSVQVEGMGQCISLVTKISQILSKNGYTNLTNIKSSTVGRENSRGVNPKLSISLKKTAEFDNLTQNIEVRN